MAKTLVGLYSGPNQAQQVLHDLMENGFSHDDISFVIPAGQGLAGGSMDRSDPAAWSEFSAGGASVDFGAGIGRVIADNRLADSLRSGESGLIDSLTDQGVPRDEAQAYGDSIRRGECLVVLYSSDDKVSTGADIMNRAAAGHMESDADEAYRSEGYAGDEYRTGERPLAGGEASESGKLEMAKEEVEIGKRQVQTGGAQIRSYVVERPVEETVDLRHEKVDIERRPVDRPVEAGDDAFQEREISATESHEEPVVKKSARVTEEVDVTRQTESEQRKIRDNVRETKLDVDKDGKKHH